MTVQKQGPLFTTTTLEVVINYVHLVFGPRQIRERKRKREWIWLQSHNAFLFISNDKMETKSNELDGRKERRKPVMK